MLDEIKELVYSDDFRPDNEYDQEDLEALFEELSEYSEAFGLTAWQLEDLYDEAQYGNFEFEFEGETITRIEDLVDLLDIARKSGFKFDEDVQTIEDAWDEEFGDGLLDDDEDEIEYEDREEGNSDSTKIVYNYNGQ